MMEDVMLTVTAHDQTPPMTRLDLAGEIDRDSRQLVLDAATAALARDRTRLVLDLSEVTFCDSSGLSVFVHLHRETAARGGWLRLAAAQPLVLTVLKVTNLDRLLALHSSVDDAG